MGSNSIIAAIDKELARLHKVRSVLVKKNKTAKVKQGAAGLVKPAKKQGKRRLSPEARAKIAEAQRKRWAAVRKNKKR